MYLLVTLDVEEEFDWQASFERHYSGYDSFWVHDEFLMPFYKEHQIKPVFVVTYPVTQDPWVSQRIAMYLEQDHIILGAHLHPWSTPPFEEILGSFNAYPHNLPYGIESAKLAHLTHTLETTYGVRPRHYKAGRYGFGKNTPNILASLGYHYDLSLIPQRNYSKDGGIHFPATFPETVPYGDIVSIPVSGFYSGIGRNCSILQKIWNHSSFQSLKGPSLLSYMNLLDFNRLTPENTSLEQMKQATLSGREQGHKLFHMTFHSSVFKAGSPPYYASDTEIENLIETIQNYILFFKELCKNC